MSRLFNTPQEVADALPEEIGQNFLANYDPEYAYVCDAFPTKELSRAIKWAFDWERSYEGTTYWENVFDRALAGEFDPKGKEAKGVFVDIKVNDSSTPSPLLDEIKAQVAEFLRKNYTYYPWVESAIIEYTAHELQRAERAEAEVELLKETLKEAEVFLANGPWPSTKMLEKIRAVLAEKGNVND